MSILKNMIRTYSKVRRGTNGLSGDESEENINWEQFECPMSFSQCHYDWCASSDNSAMVNMLFSKYNIYMI